MADSKKSKSFNIEVITQKITCCDQITRKNVAKSILAVYSTI